MNITYIITKFNHSDVSYCEFIVINKICTGISIHAKVFYE